MSFTERSKIYSERIQKLVVAASGSRQASNVPPLWLMVPVSQWSSHEISDWFHDAAKHIDIKADEAHVLLDNLSSRTGYDLFNMTRADFVQLNQRFGERLFESLHRQRQSSRSFIIRSV